MLWGYANGIFPMADSADDAILHWLDPLRRGIMPIGGVHASGSMRRHLRRSDWQVTLNRRFGDVVRACAARSETWINAELHHVYDDLHRLGHAHSIEVLDGDLLVGGIFGLTIGAAFFGESMFSGRTNGSKTALIVLSAHLAACGFRLFDTQYPTPHLESLGGQTISRADYRSRLADAIQRPADITALPLPSFQAALQASTQTS
ncbi:leucyl/phenylalanyl-tRNA--protein transferase [Paracoccus xiamenensis]|uniref:leucyl/phenylalanyl-tRNA--protein transferase n=1 Tax=Paracoccus xiamenensis TaxID=2714901 RepID=UPI00140DE424|nr:leucyl/phenylalanyl-tRNA--protein transferase [Paracoccus xiamenensis]NHF73403.1 leucyl/phenylalanyl-tRNA--protein transferase [Paracoccus xiamenensis]